ncbi:MAG: Pycsar system effector family protein [Patescibacteria group bacterium]
MNKENLENNLSVIHEWIRSADQKSSIWLAFQGVCLTIIISSTDFEKFVSYIKNVSCFDIVILILVLILCFYSVLKTIFSILPTVKVSTGKESMIYFGSIAKNSLKKYKEKMIAYDDDDYKDDLLDQIYISSLIVNKKLKFFSESVSIFILSFIIIFIFFLVKIF